MAPLTPLPESLPSFLGSYLPPSSPQQGKYPFVTLTYAQSLDSRISTQPGVQTAISHLETKTMTHYLRSKHDSILVGIGTVLADDPGLNCRYGNHLITPIIIDPSFKFLEKIYNSRLIKTLKDGEGLAPYILVSKGLKLQEVDLNKLSSLGVKIIRLPSQDGNFLWTDVLKEIRKLGLHSVMVEGGARIINDLLMSRSDNDVSYINSLIITIGPVYLGRNGVEVSPSQKINLKEVKWWTGVKDSVLAAKID